jgi:hypothetical protein
MKHQSSIALSLLSAVSLAATAVAQPSIISLGMGVSDLTGDGNTIAGTFYDAAAPGGYPVCTWTRGVGVRRTSAITRDGSIRCSESGNEISYGDYNFENIGNLSYGQPGWYARTAITHRWSPTSGPVNCGMPANGNRCDFNINTPYDISGNGRYIVGGGWTNGLCGPFRCFRYDSVTGTYNILPVTISPPPASVASRATRGNAVSFDGKTVCGYDENYDPGLTQISRHAVVWYRNATDTGWVTAVLDPRGGEAFAVSGDGTCVFGEMSSETMQATFGTTSPSAIRWKRNGSQWIPQRLGAGTGIPTAASFDGEVAVGEQFFWKSSFNGGQAMNLSDYFRSQGGTFESLQIGSPAGVSVWGVSNDGNVIAVKTIATSDPCLSTFNSALLYLNTIPCEQPRVVLSPVSDVAVVKRPGYYSYGVILNAFVSGTWPLNYQWQKFDDSTGLWTDLQNDQFCNSTYDANNFDIKAVHSSQLRIGFLSGTWQGRYRCVVSNSCGTITTDAATISAPFCPADFNGDGGVDGADVEAFFSSWQAGESLADVNFDGGVDGSDVESFFAAWAAGGC